MASRKVTEKQDTISDGNIVNGEILFRIEDIPIDEFIAFRGKIRALLGFGHGVVLDHAKIEEKALVVQNLIEHHPEHPDATAIPPPMPGDSMQMTAPHPVQRLPGQIEKVKQVYIHRRMRDLLAPMTGLDQAGIIAVVRGAYPRSKYSNQEILQIYNRIHGIR